MKKILCQLFLALICLILKVSCRNSISGNELGGVTFNIRIINLAKSNFLYEVNSDTLSRVFFTVFKDSILYASRQARLAKGVFTAEIPLQVGSNYFARAEAHLRNLEEVAFRGTSKTFSIFENKITVVEIFLTTTADSVRIRGHQDTLRIDETLFLKAVAFYAQPSSREVTPSSIWDISPGVAASINDMGKLTPVSHQNGKEIIRVNYRGLVDSVLIVIE